MKNQIVLGVMKVWSTSLAIMAATGLIYAVVSLCVGNYTSTPCFEF